MRLTASLPLVGCTGECGRARSWLDCSGVALVGLAWRLVCIGGGCLSWWSFAGDVGVVLCLLGDFGGSAMGVAVWLWLVFWRALLLDWLEFHSVDVWVHFDWRIAVAAVLAVFDAFYVDLRWALAVE